MIRASHSPSRIFGVGGVARCLRSSALSNPSSTQRWRIFSTVFTRHENAAAISRSVHPRPVGVGLQQNLSTTHPLARPFEPADDIPTDLALLLRQADNVALLHNGDPHTPKLVPL